jgi:hypothetical protein
MCDIPAACASGVDVTVVRTHLKPCRPQRAALSQPSAPAAKGGSPAKAPAAAAAGAKKAAGGCAGSAGCWRLLLAVMCHVRCWGQAAAATILFACMLAPTCHPVSGANLAYHAGDVVCKQAVGRAAFCGVQAPWWLHAKLSATRAQVMTCWACLLCMAAYTDGAVPAPGGEWVWEYELQRVELAQGCLVGNGLLDAVSTAAGSATAEGTVPLMSLPALWDQSGRRLALKAAQLQQQQLGTCRFRLHLCTMTATGTVGG